LEPSPQEQGTTATINPQVKNLICNQRIGRFGVPAAAPGDAEAGGPRAALSAHGLTKIYRMGAVEVPALRGVDVSFYEGELAVLLGPSGSGKSTLLNILGGLDVPTEGEVRFHGEPLTDTSERGLNRYRRDHVGFVFQFYNLIPSLTARENVALVTEIARDPMTPEDALALVGLGERLDHFPAQLSGGEQQRVAIARAIAKRPALLLCDEPTGALDSETGILVLEAILRVNREIGATTALITHNAVIAGIADRVLRFGDGRIVDIAVNETRRSPQELSW
jgi:putative ABC transport system ATP-binding protein